MKRFGVLFCLLVLLTACTGSGSKRISCKEQYWDGSVGTCLPAGWIVIDRETLRQRGVPDETIAGFQAEEPVSGQFPTVTITREILLNSVTPKEYSDSGLQQVAALPGYEEIDSKSVTIDEEKISMHVFVAKPVATEPARRFTQVSTVYDGNGYAVTAMTPISVEDDLDQAIELILKNVIFKEPVEEDD